MLLRHRQEQPACLTTELAKEQNASTSIRKQQLKSFDSLQPCLYPSCPTTQLNGTRSMSFFEPNGASWCSIKQCMKKGWQVDSTSTNHYESFIGDLKTLEFGKSWNHEMHMTLLTSSKTIRLSWWSLVPGEPSCMAIPATIPSYKNLENLITSYHVLAHCKPSAN